MSAVLADPPLLPPLRPATVCAVSDTAALTRGLNFAIRGEMSSLTASTASGFAGAESAEHSSEAMRRRARTKCELVHTGAAKRRERISASD